MNAESTVTAPMAALVAMALALCGNSARAQVQPTSDSVMLSSYFEEGNLQQAKEQFDRGAYARARNLLAGEIPSPPVRFLAATCAARLGEHESAAAQFETLADEYPAMRDRCLFQAARAQERLKHLQAAKVLYLQVDAGSTVFDEARLAAAMMLKKNRDFSSAIAALIPLASAEDRPFVPSRRPYVLMSLADLARDAKNRSLEQQTLFEIWAAYPSSGYAFKAKRRLGKAVPPPSVVVRRAESLIELHQHPQGLALLGRVLKSGVETTAGCQAFTLKGKLLRKERQHRQAIAVLRPVVEKCTDPDVRSRALFMLASSQVVVEPEQAAATFEALAHDYPQHALADDALFFAGEMHVRADESAQAFADLEQVTRIYPSGDYAAEALFRQFWGHWELGELDSALTALSRTEVLDRSVTLVEDLARARYWKARVLSAKGDDDQAASLLASLISEQPGSYYALMARTRLENLDPAAAAAALLHARSGEVVHEPIAIGSLKEDPHFLSGVELLRLGFRGANTEFLAIDRPQREAPIRLVVEMLNSAGYAPAAQQIARAATRAASTGPMSNELTPVWKVAYPSRFSGLVVRSSKVAGVDPNLLWALMREESGFNPNARSSAGALGLTQLMPSTAVLLVNRSARTAFHQDALFEPATSIKLGALYLGGLLREFESREAYAIASYNAGPGAVKKWLRASPESEVDEWVEKIPFDETRNYVKRVLSSYNTYQLLYAHAHARPMRLSSSRPVKSGMVRR